MLKLLVRYKFKKLKYKFSKKKLNRIYFNNYNFLNIQLLNKFYNSNKKNYNIFWSFLLKKDENLLYFNIKNIINALILPLNTLILGFDLKLFIILKKFIEIPLSFSINKFFNKKEYLFFINIDIIFPIIFLKNKVIKSKFKYIFNK